MTTDRATSEEAEASNPFESDRAHQWVEEGTATPDASANGREATTPTDYPGDAPSERGHHPLGYTRCPECTGCEFVAKQLVYETRRFDEHGTLASIDSDLRGELEFVCADCGTCLREMPASQRTFYDEVDVLHQDLTRAVRRQLRCWAARVRQRVPVL